MGESNLSRNWLNQVVKHFPRIEGRFHILNDGRSILQRIKAIESAPSGTIFIINLEAIRNKKLVEALNRRNLAVCVIDECQYITGSSAQQTAGMHALQSDYRWALSATPIRNTPIEWFSLLAWLRLMPFDGMLTRFKQYYAYAVRNEFGQWEYDTFRHQEDLEDLKNLISIRVEKKGLNLPHKHLIKDEIEMTDELRSSLKRLKSEKRKDWIDTSFEIYGEKLEAKNLPALFYIERVLVATAKNKIDYVLQRLSEPAVIVSNLKFPLSYIHSLLPTDSVLYHGDISRKEREDNLNLFLEGKKKVLLMTRKSGGTGLDGLQHRTRLMFFLDAPENESDFGQCIDRLHRNGQEREVLIYIPQVNNSIDLYAWNKMDEKQGWIDRYYKVNYGE